MDKKILILMATYNGQLYIKKQLDSICNQSLKDWKLIIRDDGSSDETIEIIREYCKKDGRIHLVCNETSLHGAYQNFWALIDYAKKNEDFDYCFFSDQDDIWPIYKLELMTSNAAQYDQDIPLLEYGDMQIINEKDEIVENSLNEIMGIGHMSGYTQFYSAAFVWGCNMMINRKLIDIINVFPLNHPAIHRMSHDNYYTKVCLITGNVIYLPKPCLLHRRHTNNVTSGNHLKLSLRMILNKFLFGFSELCQTHANGYAQTLFTLECMENAGIKSNETNLIKKAILNGGVNGCRIMIKHHVKRFQISRSVGIYFVMFVKGYRKYLNKILREEKL